jgi:hypothetical protein
MDSEDPLDEMIHSQRIQYAGATMPNLGQFRRMTADLPDDVMLLVDETEDGSLQFAELYFGSEDSVSGKPRMLPAAGGLPAVLLLGMGQVWNSELKLDQRMDADFAGLDPNLLMSLEETMDPAEDDQG